jgi:hypothetical protein
MVCILLHNAVQRIVKALLAVRLFHSMPEGYSQTVIAVFLCVCLTSAAQIWARSDTNVNVTGDQQKFTFCSPLPNTIRNVTDTLISDMGVTLLPQLSKYSDNINDMFLSQCTDMQVHKSKIPDAKDGSVHCVQRYMHHSFLLFSGNVRSKRRLWCVCVGMNRQYC